MLSSSYFIYHCLLYYAAAKKSDGCCPVIFFTVRLKVDLELKPQSYLQSKRGDDGYKITHCLTNCREIVCSEVRVSITYMPLGKLRSLRLS